MGGLHQSIFVSEKRDILNQNQERKQGCSLIA